MCEELNLSKKELISNLFNEDKNIKNIFSVAMGLEDLRKKLFNYLNDLERSFYNIYCPSYTDKKYIIEKKLLKSVYSFLKIY